MIRREWAVFSTLDTTAFGYATDKEKACRRCQLASSGPAGPDAQILPGWTPLVCHRHRRWLGRDHDPAQHDLSAAPDVLAASRRLARVLARAATAPGHGKSSPAPGTSPAASRPTP